MRSPASGRLPRWLIILATLPAIPLSAVATPEPPGIARREMSAGSPCAGAEGQWNCMTDRFQRCASGQWSVPMQCAAGTRCAPSGLTYDLQVQAVAAAAAGDGGAATNGGGAGGAPTSGTPPVEAGSDSACLVDWWLLAPLVLAAV
ncbi:hypothetical protein F4780DRAFT_751709 [Xylariomycetidae sp. FL0641]|nr:hypothetical protein F4780DRAFT_751709 [Xylariomycetidae sp. FL0641]